ncbi:MAG: HAMP domain-containing protein [Nitrospinota bacterium]|nr:MAG: HAMP domain-containing protein [Nitrospinota bacterium]
MERLETASPGVGERGVQVLRKMQTLKVKVIGGIVLTVCLLTLLFFYFLYNLHRGQLFRSLKDSTTELSRLIESSLEYAMLSHDLRLLIEIVKELSQQQGVESVRILDPHAVIRITPEPELRGKALNRGDPNCQVCHRFPPEQRENVAIITTPGGKRVFRTMTPIYNKPPCYTCHDPGQRINGVLLMDFSLASIEKHLRSNLQEMVLWMVTMVSSIILVASILLNKVVLKKLKIFVEKSRLIGQGHLHEAIPVQGKDEIAQLAEAFNQMTHNLEESMQKVQQHKDYLENLINSISDGIVVLDRDHHLVLANRAYRTQFSAPSQTVHSIVFGGQGNLNAVEETFQQGKPHTTVSLLRFADGEERYVEIFSSPLFNERGEVFQVVEVWRDITARKHLEAGLSHAERLASLGVLASGIAHEINNPLASVTTCIEGLQRRWKLLPPERRLDTELEEYLQLILTEIQRCKETTEKLRILSRKPRPSSDFIDLNRALRDTISLLTYEAQANQIQILENLDPHLPLIRGDESQLRQVWLNIALNAIQAMESGGGTLYLSTCCTEDGVQVTFRDTGPGIAPEDRGKIFEPFFTRKEKGTGLGLFIAHSIIHSHGGKIRVESAPQQGATFIITLPVEGISPVIPLIPYPEKELLHDTEDRGVDRR